MRLTDDEIAEIRRIFARDSSANEETLRSAGRLLMKEVAALKAELAEAKPYKDQHDRSARQMRMGL